MSRSKSKSRLLLLGLGLGALGALVWAAVLTAQPESEVNTLSEEERAQGWRLLFDGRTFDGWRGYGGEKVPEAWEIQDGAMAYVPGKQDRGDIMTEDEFKNFELRLQWKISPGGNSGIFFHVDGGQDWSWQTGPEMQVLDNEGHADGRSPLTSAGSNYALHAPSSDVTRPVGEWNQVRILVEGPHVEHWLNGVKIVEYELWSEDWEQRVEASKFKDMDGYGRAGRGHIVLQDHGNKVWFRDIKIRPIQ
ncbi:MAG TPA: DUF1080 domain-containing protein [Acidobacteriota bacterium]|nr:DUF1080 domain-containing protein [Acidobacteriota bacterium]